MTAWQSTPWIQLADALLHRAALVVRVGFDRLPSPLAGLRIDDDDVLRAVADLPGRDTGDDETAQVVLDRTSAAIESALEAFIDDASFHQLIAPAALEPQEATALALLAAIEMDPRRQRLVAFLNDDVTQRCLTPYSLSQVLMTEEAWGLVRPDGGLRRSRFIDVDEEQSWSRTPIRVSPFVCWRLAGHGGDDSQLPLGAEVREFELPEASVSQPERRMLVVAGSDRVRRLQVVSAHLRAHQVLVVPMPDSTRGWDALVRQASLDGLPVVLETEDLTVEGRHRIERADHLQWAISSRVDLPIESLPRTHWWVVEPATALATSREITDALGPQAVGRVVGLTATQLDLTMAAASASDGDVEKAVRRLAAGRVDRLAVRTVPRRGWDDLVLKDDRRELVREVVVRYRHRQRVFDEWGFRSGTAGGVLALFSGESGTGKTLSAEVVAKELGHDLYTVDLSRMVSKYIGETEKNLDEVFSAAEISPIVLFFDEADAILGKRSEVTSGNDRYSNVEVAYLLQRIERHNGVVVLATNLASNIDRAFLRRIHVSVDFPMPDEAERLSIWRRSLPPGLPSGEVDLQRFAARFEMAGGSIRNAALTAAFMAADGDGVLTTEVLSEAVRRELRKGGKYFRDAEFTGLAIHPSGVVQERN